MNDCGGRSFEEAFAMEHDQAIREMLLPLMVERAGSQT
jgi:hypothetical protein